MSRTDSETKLYDALHDLAMNTESEAAAVIGRVSKVLFPVVSDLVEAEQARGTSPAAIVVGVFESLVAQASLHTLAMMKHEHTHTGAENLKNLAIDVIDKMRACDPRRHK